MSAYLQPRTRGAERVYRPTPPESYRLDDARDHLRAMLPALGRWTPLSRVAPAPAAEQGPTRASYVASTLSASLELAREGELDVRQLAPFAEIYLRSTAAAAGAGVDAA